MRSTNTTAMLSRSLSHDAYPRQLLNTENPENKTVSYAQTYFKMKLKKIFEIQEEVRGFCFGLNINWLLKMKDYAEEDHYSLIKLLIEENNEQTLKTKLKQSEHINAAFRVVIAQFPYRYPHAKLNHDAIDSLMEHVAVYEHEDDRFNIFVPSQRKPLNVSDTKIDTEFCDETLDQLLRNMNPRNNNVLVINSKHGRAHSVAIFLRDKTYYLYDCNYAEGRAKTFSELQFPYFNHAVMLRAIRDEILSRQFTSFDEPIQAKYKLRVYLFHLPAMIPRERKRSYAAASFYAEESVPTDGSRIKMRKLEEPVDMEHENVARPY